MSTAETFLLALLIIFSLPWLIWRLSGGTVMLPLVVVQIVAGILLGPGVMGLALPDLHEAIFRPDVILALNGVAWWAVIVFVFLAGLELDLSEAWTRRRETVVTAGLALLGPLVLGA